MRRFGKRHCDEKRLFSGSFFVKNPKGRGNGAYGYTKTASVYTNAVLYEECLRFEQAAGDAEAFRQQNAAGGAGFLIISGCGAKRLAGIIQ